MYSCFTTTRRFQSAFVSRSNTTPGRKAVTESTSDRSDGRNSNILVGQSALNSVKVLQMFPEYQKFSRFMYPIALIVAGEVRSLRCKGQLRSEAVTTHISRNLLSTAVVSLFFMAMPAWAQTTLEAPTDLVKEVIYNELHPADAANVRWKYQLAKEADG